MLRINVKGQFLHTGGGGDGVPKKLHVYQFALGASAGAREPLLRVASKLYGKRGAQDDHVAAKHRRGGNARNARCGLARSQP